MHEHACLVAGRLGLPLWIFLGAVFARSRSLHHPLWHCVLDSLVFGHGSILFVGRSERRRPLVVVGCRTSQGTAGSLGDFGDAHYFLSLSQVLLLPSDKQLELVLCITIQSASLIRLITVNTNSNRDTYRYVISLLFSYALFIPLQSDQSDKIDTQ